MISPVSNVGTMGKSTSVAFRGTNSEENATQAKPASNYSNCGLKVGTAQFALGTILSFALLTLGKKGASKLFASLNIPINNMPIPKISLINILKTATVSLGCGAIVDFISNKNKNKFNEDIAGKDKKDIVLTNKNADVTDKGNVYYKSNDGKKYGALLGAGAGLLTLITGKIKGNKVTPLIANALGGLALGAITDHFTNKNNSKEVDSSN